MSYQVRLRRAVQKQLDKLAEHDYEIVAEAISALQQEPRPRGVKRLAEGGLWLIKVGQYRISYTIDDKERQITVVQVSKRTEHT